MTWLPISTAPKYDLIIAREGPDGDSYATWWGLSSTYEVCWMIGTDPEDVHIWEPTEWLEGSQHFTDY